MTEYENENNNEIYQLHWFGRFGNRIFLYIFVNEWARLNNGVGYLPSKWEGDTLFEASTYCKVVTDDILRLEINQTHPSMDNAAYRKSSLNRFNQRNNTNIVYLDTRNITDEKQIAFDDLNCMYFRSMHKKMDPIEIKKLFIFKQEIIKSKLYQDISEHKGTYIVAHLRRGDIASRNYRGAHSMVTKESYLEAFRQYGVPEEDVIWLSDDSTERTKMPFMFSKDYYSISKGHLWSYPEGEHPQNNEIIFDFLIELLLLKFAKKIFRANSSFSWFGAFISEAEVYSPVITSKPTNLRNSFYKMDCKFVPGNKEGFMGSKEEGFQEIFFGEEEDN